MFKSEQIRPTTLSRQRRLQIFWQDYGWPIILIIWIVALALGYIGFTKEAQAAGQSLSASDNLYRTLQLVAMELGDLTSPVSWELNVARFLIPAMAAYTAIRAFAAIFGQQVQLIRLWFARDHIIICGLGQKGFLLANQFRARKEHVVIVEQDEDNNLLPLCQERGIMVLTGDATDAALLQKAAIRRAKYLIAVCGDDGINTEIAVRAQELAYNRSKNALTCIIHIVDVQLRDLLREQELVSERDPTFRLQIFNTFDRGARLLLQEYPALESDGNAPHLLVIGLGHLGESLVVNAGRLWQDRYPSAEQQLRITAIDRKAQWEIESLYVRYPQLTDYCHIIPLQMDILSPEFQRAEFLFNGQGRCEVDIIYICLDDDSKGLHTGLTLLRQIQQHPIPVVIRMAEHTGLATLLRKEQRNRTAFRNLHAFGLLTQTCTPALVVGGTHEVLAQVLHEEYIKQQQQLGQTAQTNPAMVSWNNLPEPLKESNRRQVDHIRDKLRAIGADITALSGWGDALFEFAPAEVELMACMEHERWLAERLQEGWKYAPGPKDIAQKTHPDILPWDQLPATSQEWNRNTTREMPKFLARAGFQIYRSDG